MSTTVLSYNLCHGQGLDDKIDLIRQAAVISSRHPRFVALQELDRRVKRSGYVDEPARLAELTGYKAFFGKAIPLGDDGNGEYGIAILTADQNAELAAFFALPGEEPRAFIAVRGHLEDGSEVIFACTHLDLNEKNRIASVRLINEWVKLQPLPVLFMGDFNCKGDSAPYQALCETWQSAWGASTQPTHPANAPKIDIDHLFMYPQKAWNVEAMTVVEELVASDHRPIEGVVELKKKAPKHTRKGQKR